MYYQNYEDYMRSVLGYPNTAPENTYTECEDCYFGNSRIPQNAEESELYPEIYNVVYPMVRKLCDENSGKPITRDLINQMTNTIYMNIEVEEKRGDEKPKQELRNGDVRNPNSKENIERETRSPVIRNQGLRDLITILLLRELFDRRRPPFRPPFPGPGPRPRPPFPIGPRTKTTFFSKRL